MYAKSAKDLEVYKLAYQQAMEIFELSKKFPKNERYSLTDQIRRSSRSVCSNLKEAWAKRRYIAHFISKITDCDGENSETLTWLNFAKDCGYIESSKFNSMVRNNKLIGQKLGTMINKADSFCSQ